MTPAARFAAAVEILDRWRDGAAVEQALTGWARGARYAGSKDRAAIRDHVFDILRMKGRCAALGGGEEGRALVLGLLRLTGRDPETVFTGEGHAPAPLSDAERQRGLAGGASIRLDTPDWLLARLAAGQGADTDAILAAMAERAPLFLRVNRGKTTAEGAIAALAAEGIAAEKAEGAETALRVGEGARRLRLTAAYRDGLVEPQDLSVQIALQAVDWPATGRILDYCAGGGGKALAIADRSAARVFVHDANPRRMADIPDRAARAGVRLDPLATGDLAASGPFDLVLCDVPCSGSGTWRRDPEVKWRLTPEALSRLLATQAGILEDAANLVRAGGRLVYMTCSLLEEENGAQVAAFLRRHPGWRCTRDLRLTPLTASDGFFMAELTRAAGGT